MFPHNIDCAFTFFIGAKDPALCWVIFNSIISVNLHIRMFDGIDLYIAQSETAKWIWMDSHRAFFVSILFTTNI